MMDLVNATLASDSDDSWSDAVSSQNESMVPDSNISSSVIAADWVMFEATNSTIGSNDINIQAGLMAPDPSVTESQSKLDDNMSETRKPITETTVVGKESSHAVSEASAYMSDYMADDDMSDTTYTVTDDDSIAQESDDVQSEGSKDIAMVDAAEPESSVADETVVMSSVIASVLSKTGSEPNFTSNHHIDQSVTDTIKASTTATKAKPMSSSVNVPEENEAHANEELAIAEHRKEAAVRPICYKNAQVRTDVFVRRKTGSPLIVSVTTYLTSARTFMAIFLPLESRSGAKSGTIRANGCNTRTMKVRNIDKR